MAEQIGTACMSVQKKREAFNSFQMFFSAINMHKYAANPFRENGCFVRPYDQRI